jgi:hypothetical protein
MPRVVVKGGVLVPLEPLPPDWSEGQEFDVWRGSGEDGDLDDEYWNSLDRIAAEITPDDFQRMQAAIDEHRREAKDWMRRRMGLP